MERKKPLEINLQKQEETHSSDLSERNGRENPWELVDEYIISELSADSLYSGSLHDDKEKNWSRLYARVQANDTSTAKHNIRGRHTHFYRSAIALLVVVSAILGIGQLGNSPTQDRFEYSASTASQGNITLPDGTEILLNPGSSISVEPEYLNSNRTVHLAGTAKFIVKQKGAKPFTVITDNAEVRVLGTVFSVSSQLHGSTSTFVRVNEGRVAVGDIVADKGQTIAVTSEAMHFTGTRTSSHVKLLNGNDGIDYENGLLLVTDIKIEDLIPYLNEWYGINIIVNDRNILETLVTAQFKLGTVTDLMDMMESIFGAKVIHKGQSLIFTTR